MNEDHYLVIADTLLVALVGNADVPVNQPLERTLRVASGWLGVAAGPACLLLSGAHPTDIVFGISCCGSDDDELVLRFAVVLLGDGSLTVLVDDENGVVPWRATLAELANSIRAGWPAPEVGVFAPSSAALH